MNRSDSKHMPALVKEHPGADGLVWKEVPVPECGENEVLIRVCYAGVCGTDIHIQRDEYKCFPPVIIGHEFSGEICEAGKNVSALAVGDQVVSLTCAVYCGTCDYCRQGLYMLCPDKRGLGSGYDGAFAEYLKMPAELVMKIPDNVDMKEAALSEPLASVVRAVIENANVKPGDHVYISGPGLIGQLTAQLCKLSGAQVTIAGMTADRERLALARTICSAETVNVEEENPLEAAKRITKGDMYDVVFECSGARASAETCINVCRRRGSFQQIGLYGKPVPFDMDQALMKELRIATSFSATHSSWKRTMRLLAQGSLNLAPYVGKVLPFSQWEEGFRLFAEKACFKVLFDMADM